MLIHIVVPALVNLFQINFSGKTGDWKNHFTVAESEMYDDVIERELGETGIQFKCV